MPTNSQILLREKSLLRQVCVQQTYVQAIQKEKFFQTWNTGNEEMTTNSKFH